MNTQPKGLRQRLRRIPTVVWTLVVALILVGVSLLVWRSWTRAPVKELDSFDERLEAEGRGVTRADFLTSHGTEADRPMIRAFLDWVTQPVLEPPPRPHAHEGGWNAREFDYFGTGTGTPASLLAWRDKFVKQAEPLEALFDAGLEHAPHAAIEHVREGGYKIREHRFAWPGSHLSDPRYALTYLAAAYHMEALYGETDRALRGLDRLRSLVTPITTTWDLDRVADIDEARNRTYLALAMRGRLPAQFKAAWLTEEAPGPEAFAKALRGRRLLETLPTARDYAAGKRVSSAFNTSTGFDGAVDRYWYERFEASGDIIRVMEMQLVVEDVLRGKAEVSSLPTMESENASMGSMLFYGMNDLVTASRGWVRLRAMHRMFRIAMQLVESGSAPTAAALAGGPFDYAIRHRDLGDGRHELSRDPSVDLPALAFAGFDTLYEDAGYRVGVTVAGHPLTVAYDAMAWRMPAPDSAK